MRRAVADRYVLPPRLRKTIGACHGRCRCCARTRVTWVTDGGVHIFATKAEVERCSKRQSARLEKVASHVAKMTSKGELAKLNENLGKAKDILGPKKAESSEVLQQIKSELKGAGGKSPEKGGPAHP